MTGRLMATMLAAMAGARSRLGAALLVNQVENTKPMEIITAKRSHCPLSENGFRKVHSVWAAYWNAIANKNAITLANARVMPTLSRNQYNTT